MTETAITPMQGRRAERRAIAKAIMQHENPVQAERLERIGCPGILFEYAGSTEMERHCTRLAEMTGAPDGERDELAAHLIGHCRIIEAAGV